MNTKRPAKGPQDPSKQDVETSLSDPDRLTRLIKLLLIATAILVLIGGGIAYWLSNKKAAETESWNTYGALKQKYEGGQTAGDWRSGAEATEQRTRYQNALQRFLDQKAGDWDDALEPHVRWRIAKAAADHLIANDRLDDPAERAAYYESASDHLTSIRDRFADFPLNWEQCRLDDEGEPTLTRQFLKWLEDNKSWEAKHRATSKAPDGDTTLLVRTDRGDIRIKTYQSDAKDLVAAVIAHVQRGTFDGRAFVEKFEDGEPNELVRSAISTGNEASKKVASFDFSTHKDVSKAKAPEQLLPSPSRHRILADRGVVMAWHDSLTPYDEPSQLLFTVKRSPMMDYNYTPIGKIMDDASLATLDRIYAGDTWEKDDKAQSDADLSEFQNVLQAPVRIVKVLAYKGSTLLASTASDGGSAPATDNEKSLGSVKADAYKKDAPKKPDEALEKDPKKDGDTDTDADATDGN